MPKISQELASTVVYLFRQEPKAGGREVVGTGCLVARSFGGDPSTLKSHYYVVSNRHVVGASGATTIRINTKGNGSRDIDVDPTQWAFVKDGDDLAAADVTDELNLKTDEISAIHEMHFLDKTLEWSLQVGFGEDVFMLGLFVDHDGGQRNAPSARSGNISRIADEAQPIKQPHGRLRASHVVDIRSRAGFSGSPVFVYRTHASDLTNEFSAAMKASQMGSWITFTEKEHFLKLLGVHCSQFRDVLQIKEGKVAESSIRGTEATSEGHAVAIKDGDKLYVPSSMTVVIPAWRITETLDLPELERARKAREKDDDDTRLRDS